MHSFKENKSLGNKGENLVAQFLQKQNFKILIKNYTTRVGEVDIIAQKKDLIVFVEVKTRKTEYFTISNVVNKSKQLKIIKTAKQFVLKNKITDKVLRFDVATVLVTESKTEIKYIPNAFVTKY